jgi:hypothetical protein
MEKTRSDGLTSTPVKLIILVLVTLWLWVLPATLAAGIIATVVALTGGWPWYIWLILSPLLYLAWLLLFLYFCAPVVRRMGRWNPKPRLVTDRRARGLRTVIMCTLRLRLVHSLPLVPVLEQFAWGRRLVFQSYSPSVHIGKGVEMAGRLTDPDLTTIEDHVTIGQGATISAHLWMTSRTGKRMYVSAPVKIGKRAFLGGGSAIGLGCTIGEDAVILPFSVLSPHTVVPAGEIWGGNPACFQGKRDVKKENTAVGI